jgi:hypothetical protein
MNPHLQLRQLDRFVGALEAHRDYDAARQVWDQGTATMNLPPLIQPRDSVLWDPSFESGLSNISFAWFFRSLVEGVHTEIDRNEKLSGKQSLRLTFDGKHNPGADIACASGAVTPGTKYLFSGPGVRQVEVCVSREPSTDPDIHISGDAWVDDVTLVPKAVERRRP